MSDPVSITGASGATPIVVTMSSALPADTAEIKIDGVVGNAAANGVFFVKAADKTNAAFELYTDRSCKKMVAGTGSYQSGGTVTLPNGDDYAIVVGINMYPGINHLRGPETDARLFYDWLISSGGGNVAIANAKCILSSNYVIDETDVTTWQPALDALKAAFWRYSSMALTNYKKTSNPRVGRRLWVYLAGHGITPTKAAGANLDDAALLAASAGSGRYGEHLTAYSWIGWFRDAAAFDEIVLFMDYCRDVKQNVSPLPCTLEPLIGDHRDDVKVLYAAATDLDSQSWEDKIDNDYHGFFSYALLNALKNPSLLDANGRLTAASLVQQLKTEVPRLRPAQVPRFLPNPSPDITIVQRGSLVLAPNVRVTFGPDTKPGRNVSFFSKDLSVPIASHSVNGDPWVLRLEPFKLYKVAIDDGRSQIFELRAETINVQFA